jgi:hypothetical protein
MAYRGLPLQLPSHSRHALSTPRSQLLRQGGSDVELRMLQTFCGVSHRRVALLQALDSPSKLLQAGVHRSLPAFTLLLANLQSNLR